MEDTVTVTTTMIVAMIVGTIAVGRGTRLFVDDDMPLFKGFREWFVLKVPEPWNELIVCPICTSIYLAAANVTWAFVSDLHWTWWFLNLLLASAYVAAMINVRDVPQD
jgi:hypothetical protein